MGDTSIEWTDKSWNPVRARHRVTGKVGWACIHKGGGCANCFSEALNKWVGTGEPFTPSGMKNVEPFLDEKMLAAPLSWRTPSKVFVCSMTDLFAEWVPDEWIDRVFAVMAWSPRHTYQILTKRPERMRDYLRYSNPAAHAPWPGGEDRADKINSAMCDVCVAAGGRLCGYPGDDCGLGGETLPLPNVWLGVSVEDQTSADARIPLLLQTPAAVRFLSVEPLLGPVNIAHMLDPCSYYCDHYGEWPDGHIPSRGVDWVIVGGESGPGARPCDLAWIRSVVAQCRAAHVPVFVKQLGARIRGDHAGFSTIHHWIKRDGTARFLAPLIGPNVGRHPNAAGWEDADFRLCDAKGGDITEFPDDLRIRDFPDRTNPRDVHQTKESACS